MHNTSFASSNQLRKERSGRGRFFFFSAIIIIFIVAFPKAGIKISGIPVTFGYVLIFIFSIIGAMANLSNGRRVALNSSQILILSSLIPLLFIVSITGITYGYGDIGYTVSFYVNFAFFPFVLVCVLKPYIANLNPSVFFVFIRRSVTFVCIYGIFLFFWKINTGYFIEIPYLTVNADDVGELDQKHINRGSDIFKLISTYNNGNIFGVCILMLLPLYDLVQGSRILKLLVRVALILTLSRTVWLGLFAYEMISMFFLHKVKFITIIKLFTSITVMIVALAFIIDYLGFRLDFIFDSSLGGRADVAANTNYSLLPQAPVLFASEIIYISMIYAAGVIGLIFFCLSMFSSIWAVYYRLKHDKINRSLVLGMFMFLFCGLSDGAMLLIPVMTIYWMLAAIGVSGMLNNGYSLELASSK